MLRYEAAHELLVLTLTQTSTRINLAPELFEGLTVAQRVDLGAFGLLYLGYTLLSIILLLNLLIAMMSYTFADVRTESTLECRVAFAQIVTRHELIANSFGMDCTVGESEHGRNYYKFRTVERDAEGRPPVGFDPSSNPFAAEEEDKAAAKPDAGAAPSSPARGTISRRGRDSSENCFGDRFEQDDGPSRSNLKDEIVREIAALLHPTTAPLPASRGAEAPSLPPLSSAVGLDSSPGSLPPRALAPIPAAVEHVAGAPSAAPTAHAKKTVSLRLEPAELIDGVPLAR